MCTKYSSAEQTIHCANTKRCAKTKDKCFEKSKAYDNIDCVRIQWLIRCDLQHKHFIQIITNACSWNEIALGPSHAACYIRWNYDLKQINSYVRVSVATKPCHHYDYFCNNNVNKTRQRCMANKNIIITHHHWRLSRVRWHSFCKVAGNSHTYFRRDRMRFVHSVSEHLKVMSDYEAPSQSFEILPGWMCKCMHIVNWWWKLLCLPPFSQHASNNFAQHSHPQKYNKSI